MERTESAGERFRPSALASYYENKALGHYPFVPHHRPKKSGFLSFRGTPSSLLAYLNDARVCMEFDALHDFTEPMIRRTIARMPAAKVQLRASIILKRYASA